MKKDFITRYIEEKMYLQNEPLKMDAFVEFCKKRGIYTDKEELEFFEKEGLLYPLLRCDNYQNSIGTKQYISPSFQEYEKDILRNMLKEGRIYDPSQRNFEPYTNFQEKSKFTEKKSSYYSSFQIHWIQKLKNDLKIHFDLAGEKILVYSSSSCGGPFSTGKFSINDFDQFIEKYNEMCNDEFFKKFFNIDIKKSILKKEYDNFNKILKFLISIQRFYYPYSKSDAKSFFTNHDPEWNEKRIIFDSIKELNTSGFTIDQIASLYWHFSNETTDRLGTKRDDWIQLWKNINWNKKDKLEGNIRLGIEYLQWSLMLKKYIEENIGEDIPDIDELSNIGPGSVISQINMPGLRHYRKKEYEDPTSNKDFWKDKYKKLFFLANDFKLDYQPRMMVFVEGKTEEKIMPKIFEWLYTKPEELGIEIVNFKGVDKLLSTSKNAKKLKTLIGKVRAKSKGAEMVLNPEEGKMLRELIRDLENTDIIISNWTSHINYNLEKWQIIPFFVSDNEGNIKHFLEAEKPINFEGKNYNVPKEWKYLWGLNNNNKPFKGKDFEFANFNDKEITIAINEVICQKIDINQVRSVRKNNKGISKISDEVSEKGKKVQIVNKLFENLFTNFEENDDISILKRPVFLLIENLINMAILNHQSITRKHELMNKKIIQDVLNGKGYQ